MKRKVVLTCAVTGDGPIHPKYPNYPVTAEQIAAACIEAAAAGASVVHIHGRDPETGIGDRSPAVFRAIVEEVRKHNPDVLINLTTGMGATLVPDPADEGRAHPTTDVGTAAERVGHVMELRPQICTLDATTMNLEGGIAGAPDCVFMNTPGKLRDMAEMIREAGVKPEIEVFNPGDILLARRLVEQGHIDEPPLFQICLGVKWSAPADLKTLLYMKDLLPPNAVWSAFGISRWQMEIVAASTILGGHCRVGLEDNIYLERGVFATNAQLVERARRIISDLGCEVATPKEAREILGVS
ncbi:3-keto-5-aminohexanoate cleavage protein [Sinorhizobium sp. BG8]|uniref:3-keto-5-aminohexanoate cleavage protein n=1 Tax=Sinorhizobium sp. BG8 TaxID=2613773 RepID=UPI00193E838E|nr:3-keto-5-aminohexanoate cleavage protein [Sinorhizobium sp. BG8]QRM57038.1 3-keto-5-aminohexanoate cleavage protein [Sinorhizobium sp. BG8]QRM57905.1 3-keto-5-aminohexanoate cleavage protein [Sinorhizobium sp. BG8]